ncbi:thioredoxin domain-containing protein [Clostridium aestuarii]|uniref:Thioredoxin domain-containing protein n=1 Tax=Clostridium aestuarii TaxID=338193 RepID=A0ABT4D1Q5_9CLOT|nr:thioredoxin domain-containing protein [Clostridium aestuarii]MCY6484567.1 thioredoxin domain-containing protein [Clostridium aestuarii]
MSTVMVQKTNRLIDEKSPYLLQHAHNPVDWYSWCEEAFEKAKAEDKPIFLSIGYSTCHWCHVMEKESFEDEEVAKILNDNFISVKVDREERPDVDSVYMSVCQAINGNGGWPLTIIMTPDKKPFFAGTYFPKYSRYGMVGVIEILSSISEAWKSRKEEILESSNVIVDHINEFKEDQTEEYIGEDTIDKAFEEFDSSFQSDYGGFNPAPKFPTPQNLYFLLRYYKEKKSKRALEMVTKTLESMYKGGIFDHIGFGFSRYSTDSRWLVPHFEKMLYDNALLAIAYTEGYLVTGKKLYKEVAEKIFAYVIRDMTDKEGGFYCAEDADSEGAEGKFYLWDYDEVYNVLGNTDAEIFCKYYDISKNGNFEGKNIPNLIDKDISEIENDKELKDRLKSMKEKLFVYREKRIHPHKDDKILTSWNALMIVALSYGGRIFDNSIYIEAAKRSVEFIFKNLVRDDGRVLARYREGEAAHLGYLDDYAFLIWGLIELYEATFDAEYLQKAIELNKNMINYFWDNNQGGFFLYGNDSEELIVRPKEVYDGAIPSGNSVAALNMLKLSRITGNMDLEEKLNTIFNVFGSRVRSIPNAHAYFMIAVMFKNISTKEIVIAGNKKDKDVKRILNEINKSFMPFSTVVLNDGNDKLYEILPIIKSKKTIDNKSTVYLCENFACKEPITDIDKAINEITT